MASFFSPKNENAYREVSDETILTKKVAWSTTGIVKTNRDSRVRSIIRHITSLSFPGLSLQTGGR